MMAVFLSDGLQVFFVVEGGIVKDQGGVGMKFPAEHGFEPVADESGVGGARKQHRGQKIAAATRRNQAGARTFLTGTLAMDFLSPQAPAIAAIGFRFKARLVNINQVFPAALLDNLA